MALTVEEASAVNVLLEHMLNLPSAAGKVPTTEEATAAAGLLADHARRKLGAGLNSEQVRAAWPEPVRSCRVCGCTNDRACDLFGGGACSWVAEDLCSACVGAADVTGRLDDELAEPTS